MTDPARKPIPIDIEEARARMLWKRTHGPVPPHTARAPLWLSLVLALSFILLLVGFFAAVGAFLEMLFF